MRCIEAVPPGFWSVTAYDSATGFTVPNAIDRYALGGDNKLKRDADGSFTLHVQHDNPGPDGKLAADAVGAVLSHPSRLCAGA
jgi:hypothetical protein